MSSNQIVARKSSLSFVQRFKPIALLLLALGILWWLARGLNWTEVKQSLQHADWKLLTAASLVVSSTYLLRAYRWRALLAPITKAGLRDLFVATVGGFSAVFLIGRSGEVVRPALLALRDRRVPLAASFVTIMVERICDLVAIVLLFALNLVWFTPPGAERLAYRHVSDAGLALLIAAFVGLTALIIFQRYAGSFIKWIEAILKFLPVVPNVVRKFIVNLLEQLASALTVFTSFRGLLITCGWTAVLWLAVVVDNFLILRAFGIQFGISETIFVLGWALVGSLVPTPGGAAGAFHAATAASLIFLGATREQAAAISIVVHLIDFAPALFFGFYYLIRGDISLSRLRRMQPSALNDFEIEREITEAA